MRNLLWTELEHEKRIVESACRICLGVYQVLFHLERDSLNQGR
jgi:hypothetical protein